MTSPHPTMTVRPRAFLRTEAPRGSIWAANIGVFLFNLMRRRDA